MKKLFLALAVLSVSQFAGATSLRNVRLHFQEVPASEQMAMTLTSLVVFADGEVQRFDCPSHLPVVCEPRTVAHLSARQIDKIDRLIEVAREGKIERSPYVAACFMPPMSTSLFTADNGMVLLEKGHPCVGIEENTSPAARKLVGMLRRFLASSETQE